MATGVKAQPSVDSVTACLSLDNRRLDALVREGQARVSDACWPQAAHSQALLEQGLERHLRLDEEIVFPLFEARSGIVDGPTAVMREEHRCLRRALAMMRAGIEARDAGAYADALTLLDAVRPVHDAKEERILYPMIDMLLTTEDRARVAARLRRE